MKTTNNQENVHHASHDWTIFVVNMWNQQTYSKVTEQIEYLKFFIGLHAKEKILHIYSNVEQANFNILEKEGFLLIFARTIREKMSNKKNQYYMQNFNEPDNNFQQHAELTLIEKIRKHTATKETREPLKMREKF